MMLREPVRQGKTALVFLKQGAIAKMETEQDASAGEWSGHKQRRPLRVRNAWRLSLTEKCNYRCFFCHHEGMDMERERKPVDLEALREMVRQAVAEGCDTITFTGGEPLCEIPVLLAMLAYLGELAQPPDVTVVTNGSLLSAAVIQKACQYPGNFKFNVSLHAADAAVYGRITCMDERLLARVIERIRMATEAGVAVKLNAVVLRGLNHRPEQLRSLLELGKECGVFAVKFLELLVTNQLVEYYPYYYEIEAVEAALQNDLRLLAREGRRNVFLYGDTDLRVELQRCCCRLGCARCGQVSSRVVTADLDYHPCFTLQLSPFSLRQAGQLSQVLAQGDAVVRRNAQKYANGSPLIITNPRYVKRKKEYYYRSGFLTTANEAGWVKLLEQAGWSLQMRRTFREWYYMPEPADEAWRSFRKTCKVYQNEYNDQLFQALTSFMNYQGNGAGFHAEVEFFSAEGPRSVFSLQEYEEEMAQSGFKRAFSLAWDLWFFKKGEQQFSVGLNGETGMVTIRLELEATAEMQAALQLRNIGKPLLAFLGEQGLASEK